jgi:hypothetical protein
VLSSVTIVRATIEGRFEEIFVNVAPASVETNTLFDVLLHAIQIFEGLVGSTVISLIVDGAVLVAQVAPSSAVTYKSDPLEA